ncbi:MAG: hypothetical protein OXC26_01080 [Albidovulum sp.]|nr:hypothetical protein [Albidovulum sp.]
MVQGGLSGRRFRSAVSELARPRRQALLRLGAARGLAPPCRGRLFGQGARLRPVALGEVSLDPVPDGERRSWESTVESHHPKGWSRAPGGRVLQWIRSLRHGVLGGAGFAAAGCQVKPCGDFIGATRNQRCA